MDQNNCKTQNEKYIEGIRCDVSNCKYHDGTEHCTAGQIKVSPAYASTSSDTACSTFKLK